MTLVRSTNRKPPRLRISRKTPTEMAELPVTAHLEELRRRLMICACSWLAAFALCYTVAEQLFQFIAAPVRAALP